LLMKRDEGGEIRPPQGDLEGIAFDDLSAGLTDVTITRSRAIKLAGAALAGSALTLLWPAEADARNRRRRRARRARRRRKRKRAVVADTNVVNITVPGAVGTEIVRVTNNGNTPVTIDPQLVGDGFTLGDLSGLDLTLDADGGFVDIPVLVDDVDLLTDGEGLLNILDDADGLVLEVIELDATALLP
jgi:hypothetical protein